MQTQTTEKDGQQLEQQQTQGQDQEAQQPTQEEKDAEAGFAAGFAKVAKKDGADDDQGKTDETQTTTTGTATDDQSAAAPAGDGGAAASTAAPATDPWEGVPAVVREKLTALESLPNQVRNIAGHIGGLKGQLESALATAKAAATDKGGAAAAPSDKQVQAAMADPEAWKRLKDDFPDWAGPVEAEFAALRADLAKVRTELAHEAVEAVHEGWQGTVKTPQFATWLSSQSDDVKALATSSRARDAIKLLDSFKSHNTDSRARGQSTDQKQRRLAGAVVPRGTSGAPDTGISDEEAFSRGFQRVAKKRA